MPERVDIAGEVPVPRLEDHVVGCARAKGRVIKSELLRAQPVDDAVGRGYEVQPALHGSLVDGVVEGDPDRGCSRDVDCAALGRVVDDLSGITTARGQRKENQHPGGRGDEKAQLAGALPLPRPSLPQPANRS